MEATQEEIDRFMSYVDKLPNGCWYWTGGRSRGKGNKKWYGTFWFRGKSIRAHRFSCDYLGKYEPLPPGHHRDHTCVFSMCVNFEHLEKVTHEENDKRRHSRKKLVDESHTVKTSVTGRSSVFDPAEWRLLPNGAVERLPPDQWGKGISPEAREELLRFLQEPLDYSLIEKRALLTVGYGDPPPALPCIFNRAGY